MKFSDLEDFIANKMRPATKGDSQYNYQSIVIATLVQNNGTVTKKELQKQLVKHNPGSTLNDFSDCPAFKIIVREKIAQKDNANFEMLDFETYTTKQKAKIIVDCILKIPEKKDYLEDSVEVERYNISMQPELEEEKQEVLKKYGETFNSKNIDSLTKEKFAEFCNYENNHHWANLNQARGNLDKDEPAEGRPTWDQTKKALKILVDETISYSERIKEVVNPNVEGSIQHLREGIYTPILLVTSNLEYAVINGVVKRRLDDLGLFPKDYLKDETDEITIPLMDEIIKIIAEKYGFDLWQMDWVWWDIMHKRMPGAPKKYWLISPGGQNTQKDQFLNENIIAVGFVDTFLPRYFDRDGETGNNSKKWKSFATNALEAREKKKAEKEGMPAEEITAGDVDKKCTRPLAKFSESAIGDVVILWNASTKIFATGTITGRYKYVQNDVHQHHKNVVWDNIKEIDIPKEVQIGPHPSIWKLTEDKPLYKWVLEQLPSQNPKYFLLEHNVGGPYDDVLGKEYHFKNTVQNQIPLRKAGEDAKTIWYTKSEGDYYFWGYGDSKECKTVESNRKWILLTDNFTFFEKQPDSIELLGKFLKRGTQSVVDQIKNIPNFNNRFAIKIINKKIYEEITGQHTTVSSASNNYQEDLDLLEWEKNLILYGPPGTGKTYHAGKIADEFLKNNIQPTWLICAARILTEHGGTPMPYKEITNLILEENFKDASAAATPEETVSRDIREDIENNTDSFFKQEARGSYGLDTPMTFIKGIRLILSCFGEQHYTEITKTLLDNNIVQSSGATPEKTLLAIITEDISRNGVNSTFVTTNTSGVYNLRNTKPLPVKGANFIQKITFHQSYSYEEFIEGIKAEVVQDKSDPSSIKRYVNYATKPGIFKTFCSRAEVDLDNKYVLIIDELNRGNISKIFGELITVIEKDKRGTEVILPYSKLPFSVPKNVYIIGTMNTADRSIAKIDTALTRRFARREIMPDSSVLDNKTFDGINLTNLLDKLNNKIKSEYRDRQIGHSYLMNGNSAIDNISDLRLAFLYDIIPLLKELTFDDEEELKEIIGDYFVDFKTKNITENLTKTRVNTGNNHADNAFKTEMNSFLNSGRTEVESQDTNGDDDDDQDS